MKYKYGWQGQPLAPAQMKQIKGGWWGPAGGGDGQEPCQTSGPCEYAYDCVIFPAGCYSITWAQLICVNGVCQLS
jgi:hypothetical protein